MMDTRSLNQVANDVLEREHERVAVHTALLDSMPLPPDDSAPDPHHLQFDRAMADALIATPISPQPTPKIANPAIPSKKVFVHRLGIAAMNLNGDENTIPRLLTSFEMRWMKHTIQDELGVEGMKRFGRGEFVTVDEILVWSVELGGYVERDPVIEAREAAAHARHKTRRHEWAEAV